MRYEKPQHLLQEGIVHGLCRGEKTLVDPKTVVCDVCLAGEGKHLGENLPSFVSRQVSVFLLTSNQRAGVNAIRRGKPQVFQFRFKAFDGIRDAGLLVVKNEANEIISGCDISVVKATRLVCENADFLGHFSRRIQIKNDGGDFSPPTAETSPLAGDSGFRPCRLIFYQNRCSRGNGGFHKRSGIPKL